MANTTLKFGFNPTGAASVTGAQISTYGTNEGYILFDESNSLLYVRGIAYGLSKSQATTLANLATLVGATGVDTQIDTKLADALGTLNANLASGATGDTVQELITALQNQITGLDSSTVKRSTGSGHTDYQNTDAIAGAIATGVQTAIDTAASDASSKDAQVKSDLIGTGVIAPEGATGLSGDQIWLHNEAQTLSHLKELINDLGGKDLATVQTAIAAIKNELKDGSETGELANTLIDKLSGFLNSQTEWTVNGTTGVSTVQGIISALEAEIDALDADAVKDVTLKLGSGEATSIVNATGVAALSVEEGSSNGTIKVNNTDISVHGLGGAAYKAENFYEATGTAQNLIAGLDATAAHTAGTDGLALSISEVDGKITAISGSIAANTYDTHGAATSAAAAAESTLIGANTDATTANTINGAKNYASDLVSNAVASLTETLITWRDITA